MPVIKNSSSTENDRPDPPSLDFAKESDDGGPIDPLTEILGQGGLVFGSLRNKDPRMSYHLACKPGTGVFDVSFMEMLGYKKVLQQPGGPMFVMGNGEVVSGEVIEHFGQILMQIPKEKRARLDKMLQDQADLKQQSYLRSFYKTPTDFDPFRGRAGASVKLPLGITMTQEASTGFHSE